MPFCYVAGFNRSGYIHWGMNDATMGGQRPAYGSFKDARAYFIRQNDYLTLSYVF